MLGPNNLSRIAHKASPTREQRLLFFAGGTPDANTGGTNEFDTTGENDPELMAKMYGKNAAAQVGEQTSATKGQVADLMNQREPDTDAVTGKKKKLEDSDDEEHTRTPLEQIEDSREKNREFIKKLKTLEKLASSEDVVEAVKAQGELGDLEESKSLMRRDREKTEQWDGMFDLLQEWQKGKMPADDFIENMTQLLRVSPIPGFGERLAEFRKSHEEEVANYVAIEDIDSIESTLKSWKNKSVSPEKFVAAVTKYAQSVPEADPSLVEALRTYMENNAHTKLQMWDDIDPVSRQPFVNESTKLQIIAEMSEIANYDEMMTKIESLQKTRNGINEALDMKELLKGSDAQITSREGLFDKVEEGLNTIVAGMTDEKAKAAISEFHPPQGIFDMLNVKLFSPLQIWNAIKELKEAYLEGYHAWAHHGEAELAQSFGQLFTWAPFADRMETYLDKRLDSSDDEQKNKYIEHLESQHPNFLRLCYDDDSYLKKEAAKDPNHARAILEYAAKKGFLYDLDDSAGKDRKTVLGMDLRHLCHDYPDARFLDYYHKLRSENASGRESAIKHGEERVHDIENIPTFINELDHEMHEGNIWEAVGIAQRAIDRGLMSEVSPWVLMTVLRHMRESKHIQQFMPTMALDKMGALAYYRAGGWSLGYLKGSRNRGLLPWMRSGKGLEHAPDQGASIFKVEQAVRHATSFNFDTEPNGKKYLDYLVSKVLASQTLKGEVEALDGKGKKTVTFNKTVSIFSDEFSDYRNGNHLDMQGNTHPGIAKEDPDYYTAPCDNILSGAVPVSEILAPTGGGKFQNEVFAQDYIGNILTVYRNLRDDGNTTEAKNFRKEMGRKLTSHFKVVLEDTRTSGIPDYKTRISNIEQPELAMRALVLEGFLPIDIFVNTLWADVANTGTGMAKKIVRQVDSSLADRIESTKAQRTEDAKKDRSIIPSDALVGAQILNEWKASKGGKIIDLPDAKDASFILTKVAPPKKAAKGDSPKD